MDERRAAGWMLWVGGGAFALVAVAGVLWWKLPTWQPAWVMRHSPFVEPVLRANEFDLHGSAYQLFEERIDQWGSSATPSLIRWARSRDRLGFSLYLLLRVADERAAPLARQSFADIDDGIAAMGLRLMVKVAPTELIASLSGESSRRGFQNDEWTEACGYAITAICDPALLPLALRLALEKRNFEPLGSLLGTVGGETTARFLESSDANGQVAIVNVVGVLARNHQAYAQALTSDSDLGAAILRAGAGGDARVRREAATLMPTLGSAAVPTLGRALFDPDRRIGSEALAHLTQMASASCLPYLKRGLAQFPDEHFHLACAVVRIQHPDADRLLRGLLFDPSSLVRNVAIGALFMRRAFPDVKAIASLMTDPDPGLRETGAKMAGLAGHRDLVPKLVGLLKDPYDEVATEAALALGLIGEVDGVLPLISTLTSARPAIHGYALLGLAMIDNPSSRQACADYLTAGSYNREALALALAALLRWTDPAERPTVRDRYLTLVSDADLREAQDRISEESTSAPPPPKATHD